MKLEGKRVLVIGERDGVNAPAIEACVKSAGAEVLYAETLCFVNVNGLLGFEVGGVPIDLGAIKTPMLVIALKDDHVSAFLALADAEHLDARRCRLDGAHSLLALAALPRKRAQAPAAEAAARSLSKTVCRQALAR